MNAATRTLLIDGPAGAIDLALDLPAGDPAGVAVIAAVYVTDLYCNRGAPRIRSLNRSDTDT